MKETDRRVFIGKTMKTAFAVTLWNTAKFSDSLTETTHDLTLDLSQSTYTVLKTVGRAIYATVPVINEKLIIVRVSEAEVAAFSSKCTHEGCQVNLPSAGVAVCPCHNSRFDSLGNVISGPAQKDLTRYNAVLTGNFVHIDRYTTGSTFSGAVTLKSGPVSIRKIGKVIEVNWRDNDSRPLSYTLFTPSGQQLVPVIVVSDKIFTISVPFSRHRAIILKIVSSKKQEKIFDLQLF